MNKKPTHKELDISLLLMMLAGAARGKWLLLPEPKPDLAMYGKSILELFSKGFIGLETDRCFHDEEALLDDEFRVGIFTRDIPKPPPAFCVSEELLNLYNDVIAGKKSVGTYE